MCAVASVAMTIVPCDAVAQQGSPASLKSQVKADSHTSPDPTSDFDGVIHKTKPSDADPSIKRFDKLNLALFRRNVRTDAPLLVFFPGTGSEPTASWPFLVAGANAGYRVIGLMYDNGVSDPQTCGPQPDPACSDRFREKRIFGDGDSADIDDLPNESVVSRLRTLLHYLEQQYPHEHWGRYLKSGLPDWSRIAVSGHSQGGGVAAYIGKKREVLRVINLSGAWDRTEVTKEWAPWITSVSATPLDRWYCAYHAKESRAAAMKAAYAVMKIPADHIRVLTLEPNPANKMPAGADVYHVSMSASGVTPLSPDGTPAYSADWAFLLGSGK